jgi:hypothetical protein
LLVGLGIPTSRKGGETLRPCSGQAWGNPFNWEISHSVWISEGRCLPDLNAVIASFGFKSRGLVRVFLMYPTRSERVHFGFASAVFQGRNLSIAVFSEYHPTVFRCLDACSKCWSTNFACVEWGTYTEK